MIYRFFHRIVQKLISNKVKARTSYSRNELSKFQFAGRVSCFLMPQFNQFKPNGISQSYQLGQPFT